MTNKERILIVDDDESTCRTLRLIFSKEGYGVEIASTGREAIEKVQRSFFNVVLLDIKLPDIEGVELIALLKEFHPDMAVIMVTAYATIETAVLTLHEGASAYIIKPLNMDKVLIRVRDALEKQHLAMENRRLYVEIQRELEERKRAEEKIKEYAENLEKLVEERTKALRDSEEKLNAILTGIGDLITIQNKELDIIWVNQQVRDIWGDVIGKKCYEVYKGLTAPCFDCYVETVFNEDKTIILERVNIRPDGKQMHILLTGSPVKDVEGNIVAIVEVEKDITKRKQLELQLKEYTENLEKLVEERTKALRESEEKLEAILSGIADLITIQNKDLDIIWVNQPMIDIYGDVIGKKCYKVYKGLDTKCPGCTVEAVLNENKIFISEGVNIRPDGKQMHILTTSSSIKDVAGNAVAVVEVVKDITERKQAEEALKESEARMKEGQRVANYGNWDLNIETNELFWSDQIYRIFGLQPQEFGATYEAFLKSVHPDDREFVKESVNDTLYKKNPYAIDHRIVLPDGSVRFVHEKAKLFYNESGKPIRMLGTVQDITERKRAEEKLKEYTENLEKMVEERTVALRESEELYKTLVKTSPDSVTVFDLEGRIIDVSMRSLELHNFKSAEEVIGKSIIELIAPEDHENAMINLKKTLEEDVTRNAEYILLRKDGSRFIGELNSALVKDLHGNPKAFIATTRDITERKELEEIKERFVSVATHELRTPLISIKGYVDYLLSENLNSSAGLIKPSLKVVSRNTDRLLYLTNDLLDIQRAKVEKLNLNWNPLEFNEIIDHCAKEIQPFLNEKKQNFHLEVPDGPLLIKGDRMRMSQVIMNLLNNSTKFTAEGGSITLLVEEKEGFIHVQISDTGIGLRKEDLERVFQPFVNIKKPTSVKGTGLGLSVTKGLVEAHGGEIWAHSEGEGKGATFTFTVPIREERR